QGRSLATQEPFGVNTCNELSTLARVEINAPLRKTARGGRKSSEIALVRCEQPFERGLHVRTILGHGNTWKPRGPSITIHPCSRPAAPAARLALSHAKSFGSQSDLRHPATSPGICPSLQDHPAAQDAALGVSDRAYMHQSVAAPSFVQDWEVRVPHF
ncbi:Hypothetical predicted protein, partial [Olea europaea subsp. europaea]